MLQLNQHRKVETSVLWADKWRVFYKAIDFKFAVATLLTGEQPKDWGDSKALPLAPPALPSAQLILMDVRGERGRQVTRLVSPALYSSVCAHKAGMKSQGLNKGTADPSGYSVMPSDTLSLNCQQTGRKVQEVLDNSFEGFILN